MYKDFIAGWAAGGTGLVIGHPLDTVKARLQTIGGYSGIFDCIGRTFREESLFGLYKGLWVPFLSTGAMNSLLFAGYGLGLKMLHPGESNVQARKDLPMREIMLASICGTLAQVGPAIPVELIKTRLQVQRESYASGTTRTVYSGPFDCARKIIKTEGVKGLFRGGKVLFIRDNIGFLFYIPLYEGGLRACRARQMDETFSQMFCGGVAGLVGWWIITPLEVVKNKIQADKSGTKKELIPVVKEVWQKGGFRPFWRGGLTLAVRGFLVNSVVFLVYENILTLLDA